MKKIIFLSLLLICMKSYCQIDSIEHKIPVMISETSMEIPLSTNIMLGLDTSAFDDSYRRVYFIHGLGGNGASMSAMASACVDEELNIAGFPARKIEITRPEYINSTNVNLTTAAYEVRDQIRSQAQMDIFEYNLEPSRAFMIGHSQGSLVGRTILHMDLDPTENYPYFGKGYGGYVSLAGPLQGARILNNRDKILAMANSACNELTKGPLSNIPWLNIILSIFDKQELIPNTCDLVSNVGLPMFFDDYYDNITQSYKVGSRFLNILNSDTTIDSYRYIPKVAAYAVEPRDNILWRTANWIINDPNDEVPFGANDDKKLLNEIIIPAYQYYQNNYELHKAKMENYYTHFACFHIWLPLVGFAFYHAMIQEENKMNNWRDGVNWFNSANSRWETIIGARELVFESAIQSLGFFNQLMNILYPGNDPRNMFSYYQGSYKYKVNDGVVLAESAVGLPYASNPPVKIYSQVGENIGSSHMQVRNDQGLKCFLNNLFEGRYGSFFTTSEK